MSKNFAIRGHLRRGDEVIKILEMLGGKTSYECRYKDGFDSSYFFFINTDENFFIDGHSYKSEELKNYCIFTIEEFLEKYPYKVGDKVIYDGEVQRISDMRWDCDLNKVVYTMNTVCGIYDCYDVTWIRPYKKQEPIEEQIKIDIPKGYEFAGVDAQQVIFEKVKIKYPKTYEECCDVLELDNDERDINVYMTNIETLENKMFETFIRLIRCRDTYWKIAGKQMGLDEPWKPDWKDSNFKYCLKKMGDNIEKSSEMTISCILAFPTEEILNIFYNNFKNTIEQCKELL